MLPWLPANRWLELARSVAFAAGPAVGGAVVGWTGAPTAYVFAIVLSLAAVVLLSGLPEPQRAAAARRRILQELREGAAFVLGHPHLRPILVTAVFFNTAWFVLQAVYVAYAVQELHLTAAGVGVDARDVRHRDGPAERSRRLQGLSRLVRFGTTIAAGPLSALVAVQRSCCSRCASPPCRASRGGVLPVRSAARSFGPSPPTTLRQAVTPNPMLGRVSAIVMTASFGSRPVGAAIGGIVAARFGVDACLLVSAAGFAVQFLVLFASPVPRLSALPGTV